MAKKKRAERRSSEPPKNELIPFTLTTTVPMVELLKEGDILKIHGIDSLGLARITKAQLTRKGLVLVKLAVPEEREGKSCEWMLEYRKCDAECNLIEVLSREVLDAQSESEAWTIFENERKKMFEEHNERSEHVKPISSLPANEQTIHKAQWEVLKEVWPETVAAVQSKADPSKDYNAEVWARTGKPVLAVEIGDAEFLPKLEKARRRKLVFDRVNVELVTGWITAGYQDMKPREYTEKINAKLGTNLTEAAMKGRALTKLGLVSRRSEGRPANDGELPPG